MVNDLLTRALHDLPGGSYSGFIHRANATLRDVANPGRWPWKYYRRVDRLTIPPSYTDGTVTVTNGSASVTGSGTTWDASMVGWWFRLSTGGVPYRVAAVGGATALTLDRAYEGETAAGQEYRLWIDSVVLPEGFRQLRFVRDAKTGRKLDERTERTHDVRGEGGWMRPHGWHSPGEFYLDAASGVYRLVLSGFPGNDGAILDAYTYRSPAPVTAPESVIDAPEDLVDFIYNDLMQFYATMEAQSAGEAGIPLMGRARDFGNRRDEKLRDAKVWDGHLSDPHRVNVRGGLYA